MLCTGCLRSSLKSSTSSSSICDVGEFTAKEFIDQNNITFTDTSLSPTLKNPIVFKFDQQWTGSLNVALESNDLDRADSLELIDSYKTVVSPATPAKSRVDSSSVVHTLHGNVSSITFSLKVYCAQNFYGPACGTFCEATDNRYTCNDNGTKVCHRHWYGENCSVFCEPHSDPKDGYYTCDSNGDRKCRLDWFGPGCTTHCANGTHHKCNEHGMKVCLADWYGFDCNQYCKPGVPLNGHFTCDTKTGQKMCHRSWYGYECKTFCETSTSMNYTCHPATGQKQCFQDFYGVDCDVFCKSSANDNFTCNAAGRKVCKNHFHGKDCDIYGKKASFSHNFPIHSDRIGRYLSKRFLRKKQNDHLFFYSFNFANTTINVLIVRFLLHQDIRLQVLLVSRRMQLQAGWGLHRRLLLDTLPPEKEVLAFSTMRTERDFVRQWCGDQSLQHRADYNQQREGDSATLHLTKFCG